MTRKLIVEAIGTFFLVLTIGLTVLGTGAGPLAPLAIGFVLMVMVYAGGHISGAHYNPAVTLAVRLRGLATSREMGGYWIAQLAAALAAAFIVKMLLPDGLVVDAAARDFAGVAVAEFLFTFALVWVVLNLATAPGTKGNSYFGLAIGLTVTAGAFAVGPISGAAFNPAVTVAATMLGLIETSDMLLMIIIQIAAGAAGAALFQSLAIASDKPTTATPAEQERLRAAGEPGA